MTDVLMDQLERAVRQQLRARRDAIETACERMLVTPGSGGVLVTDLPLGAFTVELRSDVPFGEIHYRESL